MSKEKCSCVGRTWQHYHYVTCGRGAKYEHEGKMYCKTHHPPSVDERKRERDAQWNKDFNDRVEANKKALADSREMARKAALFPVLLEALHKIAAFRPLTFAECADAEAVMTIAETAIAKATEGTA